jgi:hypothetical protein
MENVDYFIGKNILSLYNSVYHQKKPLILFTEHLELNYVKLSAQLGPLSDINEAY